MTKSNFKQIAFTIMLAIIATFASTNVSEAVDCWHTYSAATCTRAKKCTKCGATLGYPLGHNYVVCGNTAKCTECGASKIIESVSGDEETEETPVHVHTWMAATCTAPKTCKTCNAKTGYPLGHDISVVVSTSEATCTTEGKTVKKCSRCSKTETITVAATGHNYTTKTTAATCTTAGKTVKTCSNCGDTQTTTIKALGHNYTTKTTAATCTTAGKTVKTCSRCSDSQTTTIKALGHDYKTSTVPATCTTEGKTTKACTRCTYTTTEKIPVKGHDYVVASTTATCTVPGKTVKTCKVCDHTETTEGKALGHNFVKTSETAATCTEAGKVVEKCSRCEEKKEKTTPALGHKESIVFNPDYHWNECDVCNIEIGGKEEHEFDNNNTCKVCGYHYDDNKDNEDDDDEEEVDNDELIVEPWMKENDELDCLAVSLRSEPYEEDRANKNIYALDEKVIYYVDYKNGGKDIKKDVVLKLTLPLSFSVVSSDGAKVSKSDKTLTWTFDGLERDEGGTKTVIVKYTSLGKSSITHKQVVPKATISIEKSEKDISAVLNLVVKDFDVELKDEHDPYMYGDKDTGKFRPDATITRGEGALVLTRIFGISTKYDSNSYAFPDLNETYLEARKAIIAATAHGLIEGYPDGTYKPRKAMTRGEFITILARQIEEEYGEGFEIKDESSLIKVYKDKTKIYYISENEYYDAHWSVANATLLARLNMTSVTEDETNLRLDDPITRAEVAQLVNFYLLRAPAEVTSSTKSKFPDVSKRHDLFADIIEATRDSHEYSITEDGTEEDE